MSKFWIFVITKDAKYAFKIYRFQDWYSCKIEMKLGNLIIRFYTPNLKLTLQKTGEGSGGFLPKNEDKSMEETSKTAEDREVKLDEVLTENTTLEEPILKENDNRFVLFPIEHDDIWVELRHHSSEFFQLLTNFVASSLHLAENKDLAPVLLCLS